jgi:hypothetical protein
MSDLSSVSDRYPKASPRLAHPHPLVAFKIIELKPNLPILKFEQNPSDLPPWITGLPKPYYHSSLDADLNLVFKQLFYFDEIERLKGLRPGEDWVFEHFGSTKEVSKVSGGKTQNVFARGVWKKMVDGEVKEQRLDEWPLDIEGEPLGWEKEKNSEDTSVGDWVVEGADRVGNEEDWEDVVMGEN